jgi:tRNA-dihydrouridine synthase
MPNFWNDLPKPFYILAPMEAVTDVVFRHVVAQAGRPDVFFTEFTNAASYCSPKGIHSTRGRLTFTSDEQPMVAQIWGNNPEYFAQMARGLAEQGFAGIDINTGCPDKAVVKQGSGSGLIGNYELTEQLIAAAKEGGLPVSVKARLGIRDPQEYKDWLAFLLRQDIANLTIHLRTRKEMSKVPAHFELIPEIKKLRDEIAPQTLLTINGDIRDRQHGEELVQQYGVDGIMIGRGIFTNPFAFAKAPTQITNDHTSDEELSERNFIQKHLQPERKATPGPDFAPGAKPFLNEDLNDERTQKQELLNLLHLHLDLHDKYNRELEPRRFEPLKRFFKIYIRDFPGASELREKLMHTTTTDEVRALLGQ